MKMKRCARCNHLVEDVKRKCSECFSYEFVQGSQVEIAQIAESLPTYVEKPITDNSELQLDVLKEISKRLQSMETAQIRTTHATRALVKYLFAQVNVVVLSLVVLNAGVSSDSGFVTFIGVTLFMGGTGYALGVGNGELKKSAT